MKHISILCCILSLTTLCLLFLSSCSHENTFHRSSNSEVTPIILDVRSPEEFASGHLDGAMLIPLQQLDLLISKVVRNKKEHIAVYCRTGRRSGIAKEKLEMLGYVHVSNLEDMSNAANVLNRPIVK